ncbi:MAG: ribosome silencing factor [Cyanobacteria bacterium P01_H01_bin.15]
MAPDLDDSRQLTRTIAQAADDRKGADIKILEVNEVSYLSDFFVVVTGFSSTQVRAIADNIKKRVEEQLGKEPIRIDGQASGSWIVMDYGDVIAHIFLPEEREFYNLEAFWGHAQQQSFIPEIHS